MSLIKTENLTKMYQEEGSDEGTATLALKDINLEIKEGEFVSIIGPSGSGKSTLLQILGCLDRPTSGQYFLGGKEVSSYSDDELALLRNKTFGFVFQSFNLLGRQTVLENVKLPLIYANIAEPERTRLAQKTVKGVGLEDRAHYEASKLSGGQRQRVAVARALVNNPKIIFADEPTGNLDSKSGEVIFRFFEDLNKEGHTIVLVTHETYFAEFAERIIHLKDGSIEKIEKIVHRRFAWREGFHK